VAAVVGLKLAAGIWRRLYENKYLYLSDGCLPSLLMRTEIESPRQYCSPAKANLSFFGPLSNVLAIQNSTALKVGFCYQRRFNTNAITRAFSFIKSDKTDLAASRRFCGWSLSVIIVDGMLVP